MVKTRYPEHNTMMSQHCHSERGFTLIEAAIASVILAFALVSVLAIASQSYRYLQAIRLTARSSQVLQQEMEKIRLQGWSQLMAYPSTFTNTEGNLGAYLGTVNQVAFDSYNGTTTVMKVTLTTTWKNQAGKTLTNRLTTLVTNGGLNNYIF